MNQFFNPKHRGVDLPEGCKDLMDVIRQPWLIQPGAPLKGERFSEPDCSAGTFEHIEFQASRLFMSTAQVRFLTILCCGDNDRKVVILLKFRNGALGVTLGLDGQELAREAAIRELFGRSGILPTIDAVASTAGGSPRLLRFPLPTSAPRAAMLTLNMLRKGFDLAESSRLFFYYNETPRA